MAEDDLILTVGIFGHGCEDFAHPFPESNSIGQFYKNNVRVFSQSCVPDIPSVTANHQHKSIATTIRDHMQSGKPTSDTLSLLEPYMTSCKPEYMSRFKDKKRNPSSTNDCLIPNTKTGRVD
jgi:hypothetical protein